MPGIDGRTWMQYALMCWPRLEDLPTGEMNMSEIIHVPTDADLQAIASSNYGRGAELWADWHAVTNCLVAATDSLLTDVGLACAGLAEIALMSEGHALLSDCKFIDYTLKGTQCHTGGRSDVRVFAKDCACASSHIRDDWSAIGFQADGRDAQFLSVELDDLRVLQQTGGKEPRFAVKVAQAQHVYGSVHCGNQHVVFSEGVGTFGLTLHELAWSSSHEGVPRGQPGLWFYPDSTQPERNQWPISGLDGLRFFPE